MHRVDPIGNKNSATLQPAEQTKKSSVWVTRIYHWDHVCCYDVRNCSEAVDAQNEVHKKNKSKKKNDKADIRASDVLITRGVSKFRSSANPYLQMHKISQGPEKL